MSMYEAPTPPGWYPDPTQRFEHRYWDGARWTEHVQRAGQQTMDVPQTPQAKSTEALSSLAVAKIPVLGTRRHAELLREELQRMTRLVEHHGLLGVEERAIAVDALNAEEEQAKSRIRGAENDLAQKQHEATVLTASLLDLRGAVEVQENGLYDFEHPAEDSIALATRLEAVRSRIKDAVRGGRATQASNSFTFNNSEAQGRKFVRDMSKLMLRSYNAEAENCVKAVRAGNLHTAQARLSKSVEQIERLGTMISLRVSPQFHALRLEELELANRHLRAVQSEKEAERAHKEELREQRKAEKELQAEKARLEKERSHYTNTIAALEAKGDSDGADRMRARLNDVEHAIENVDYRAANIRAGYVYVISNVGSFGPEVVKIGLTRRLEPMDRVHELGDASVPFRFDVHALFFADDAVSIEAQLHKHFAERRINKVNFRREYFRATPTEVRDALKEQRVELLDFRLDPQAEEFNATRALESRP